MDVRGSSFLSTGSLSVDQMINVADCGFLQLMSYPVFNYFFSAMIVLAFSFLK